MNYTIALYRKTFYSCHMTLKQPLREEILKGMITESNEYLHKNDKANVSIFSGSAKQFSSNKAVPVTLKERPVYM